MMFRQHRFIATVFTAFVLISGMNWLAAQDAPKWNLDRVHSDVTFKVNHFFTPVNGKFDEFTLDLWFDPNNLEGSKIDFSANIASINTGNEKRDGHLQSPDFFNAEKYPKMTFTSERIESTGDNSFKAYGKLQIKDVTKEIELPFKLLGVKELPADMQQRFGGIKRVASFQANYQLDRNDYDVGTGDWAATVVVGDQVNIDIAIEANQK